MCQVARTPIPTNNVPPQRAKLFIVATSGSMRRRFRSTPFHNGCAIGELPDAGGREIARSGGGLAMRVGFHADFAGEEDGHQGGFHLREIRRLALFMLGTQIDRTEHGYDRLLLIHRRQRQGSEWHLEERLLPWLPASSNHPSGSEGLSSPPPRSFGSRMVSPFSQHVHLTDRLCAEDLLLAVRGFCRWRSR